MQDSTVDEAMEQSEPTVDNTLPGEKAVALSIQTRMSEKLEKAAHITLENF